MKKVSLCLLICIIVFGVISGCTYDTPSLKDEGFVKPKNYAAIVNVEINPSFDIYLDEQAVVLAIEPKNENANAIDFSGFIGKELTTAIEDLVGVACKNASVDRESIPLVKFVEGDESILEVDVVEIINDACADVVAQKTVNESMDSVLQVRLEDEFGCRCLECNNWYERHWYSYAECVYMDMHKAYEVYMESWKNGLETLDKNDPSYALSLESYENMTFEKFDAKEINRRNFFLYYEGLYGKPAHVEKVITYKIIDSEVNGNGKTVQSTEYSAEEYFEKYPEDREILEGLEKAYDLYVRVYVNGQWDGNSYYHCAVCLVDGKWYASNGLYVTPGG